MVYDVYHACVNLAIFSCISSLKPLGPLVQNTPQRRLAVLLLDILNCLKGIMRNAGLDEAQAGIKIARRNINNLRHAYDTTLMAESEELNSLLMKVKRGE